ncbi:MAG: hypothetical protein KBS82_02215 [Oscillospiraceae bacterium]|nr:hypothetical protein [Candidatus Limimonas egerieequi]
MDERRRTISSEEQMIGEALMRVSNTLEAQRLTKSLDYQEKLRSRSNIRLIIAIICLFVAMMMMVISGALLFVLWRYADPVLDTVMPFLKGMMGDFGVIWDGLVETLSYVPVMVEQLTRLLEQVIIMLEGINAIDLAGLMGMLSKMLGGLMTAMDGLMADLKPVMDSIGNMIKDFAANGLDLDKLLTDLLGPDAAANISAFTQGLLQVMGNMGTQLGDLSNSLTPMVSAMGTMIGDITDGINAANGPAMVSATSDFLNAIPGALNTGTDVINAMTGAFDADAAAGLVSGTGAALTDMVGALGKLATGLNSIAELLNNIKLPSIFG